MARYHGQFYYLPYVYGVTTRAGTVVHKISFLFIVLGPVLLNAILMTKGQLSFFDFIIAFTAQYTCYEIGYLYNDVYTTANEYEPTKWLPQNDLAFTKNRFPVLVAVRAVYVVLCFLLLEQRPVHNARLFLLMLVAMNFAFACHNTVRDFRNVITNTALQILKYTAVLVLFGDIRTFALYALYICVEIALVRAVEYTALKYYKLTKKENRLFTFFSQHVDNCRLAYYLILMLIGAVLTMHDARNIALLIGTAYMFVFRIFCKVLALNNSVAKEREKFGRGR